MFEKWRPTVLGCKNTKVENENILICFENFLQNCMHLLYFQQIACYASPTLNNISLRQWFYSTLPGLFSN